MTEPVRFAIGFAGGLVTDTEGDWVSYRTYKAEIERLRTDYALLSDDYKQLLGDVERLRLQVKMIPCPEYRDDPRLHEVIDAQRAEIERLRGLLGDVQIILDSHNNIVGNLNGEITRLRGLLREGLDHHDEYNWQQRVREALGDSNE